MTRSVGREERATSGSGVDSSGRRTRFVPLKMGEVGDDVEDIGEERISTFISFLLSSVSILNRDLGGRAALCFLSGGCGSKNRDSPSIAGN